jgi:cell division protease FtsH
MVEEYGDGGVELGVGRWAHRRDDHGTPTSEQARARVDDAVKAILERERARAKALLETNRPLLVALRDLLLEKKVLDRTAFAHLVPSEAARG